MEIDQNIHNFKLPVKELTPDERMRALRIQKAENQKRIITTTSNGKLLIGKQLKNIKAD